MQAQNRVAWLVIALVPALGAGICQPQAPDGPCEEALAILCDGTDVVALDICEGSTRVLESCANACHQGNCVDCAPSAGTICVESSMHSVDSCGTIAAEIESCANGCRAGKCVSEGCTTGAATTCVGDDVYGVDSCGSIEGFVGDCPSGCEAGACTGCSPNAYSACYDGDIYNVDACMQLGDLAEECPGGCEFSGGAISCVTGVSCTPNGSQTCFAGDLHWVDSCGGIQSDIYEECSNGCDNTQGCFACEPYPVGTTCVGNEVRDLIGGCQAGACLPPGCTPEAGTVCQGDDLHFVDSCGEVGAAIESCGNGCSDGACNAPPTQYSCECVEGCALFEMEGESGTYVGACDGCWLPDWGECYDTGLCNQICTDAFSCNDGYLSYGGGMTLGTCTDCDTCASSGGDCACYDEALCAEHCALP